MPQGALLAIACRDVVAASISKAFSVCINTNV